MQHTDFRVALSSLLPTIITPNLHSSSSPADYDSVEQEMLAELNQHLSREFSSVRKNFRDERRTGIKKVLCPCSVVAPGPIMAPCQTHLEQEELHRSFGQESAKDTK